MADKPDSKQIMLGNQWGRALWEVGIVPKDIFTRGMTIRAATDDAVILQVEMLLPADKLHALLAAVDRLNYQPRWLHSGKPLDVPWPIWDDVVDAHALTAQPVDGSQCVCGWYGHIDDGDAHRRFVARELTKGRPDPWNRIAVDRSGDPPHTSA